MARVCGLNGMLYINGSKWGFTTSLNMSLERDTAEVMIQGSQFKEKCIGPYSGEFGGSGVVDDADQILWDAVTGGASKSIAIYPTATTSDYWSFSGYFTSYSTTGPADGFWTVDFGGIIDGAVAITGFV